MSDKIGYDEFFNFDNKIVNDAAAAIRRLEKTYTTFAGNLTTQAERIAQAQSLLLPSLQTLEASLGRVNIASAATRASAATLAGEIDKQTRAYGKLKESQAGVTAGGKAVEGSLAALREQLKADRIELTNLGNTGTPEKLMQLAGSILNTRNQANQLEKAVRGVNSTFTAAKGSYNALEAENRELMAELRNLGNVFDSNGQRTAEYTAKEAALRGMIANNTTTLKAYDEELNRHFRDVGNYAGSIVGAINALQSERVALLQQEAALVASNKATTLSAATQDKLQKELTETRAKLAENATALNAVGVSTEKSGNFFKDFGGELKSFAITMALTTFGFQALAQAVGTVFRNNVKYADSIADVRKTTGLAADEAERFGQSLKGIDTRTSLDDLLKIGAIGGQLNVAKKDLEGFTKSIDVASVALSDDFAGGAEQIATELGKIDAVFKLSIKQGVAGSINALGSALNDLGASGAATAPFISDYALRVGAVAKNANLGIDKVLGMGAALEELGFTAEVAGTATNKLLTALAGNADGFYSIAKIADANLTLKQFKSLVNNDINAAFNLFLKGLNKGGAATTDFASLLEKLKLKSGATVAVLTSLARNTELVSEKQVIANNSLREGTSLQVEAELKTKGLAGAYDRMKNALNNFTTGNSRLARGLTVLLNSVTAFIDGSVRLGVSSKAAKGNVDEFGEAASRAAGATLDASTASEKLLARFTDLSAKTNRSAADNVALRKATLDLKAALGDNVVTLNKESGQYELNAAAASKALQGRRKEAIEAVKVLAQRSRTLEEEAINQRALSKATEEEVNNRIAVLTAGGLTLQRLEDEQKNRAAGVSPALRDKSITDAQIDAYEKIDKLNDASALSAKKAADADAARIKIQKGLTASGFSLQFQTDLLRESEKGLVESTRNSEEADKAAAKAAKERAKALSELAQSEYELLKFRAEQRQGTATRQENNEANPEEFRTAAAKRAAAERITIAQLEQKEHIRLAIEQTDKLIGGDKILAVKRQLISEQYAAKIAEIERDLSKEQLEIRNEVARQLGEIDKFRLENANNGLQKVIDDEDASYGTRIEAQKRFAANTIAIAQLVYDDEIRQAKGNVDKITAALDKLKASTFTARDSVKPVDSVKLNDEEDKQYKALQIGLENSLAQRLITQQDYERQAAKLQDEHLARHLANTQAEGVGTKAELDERLAYLKAHNEKEIEEERRKKDARMAILEEAAQLTLTISNGLADNYITGLDNDLAALQRQKDAELGVAGNNAKAKQKIEADFDRQQAAIRRKQAVAAKAASLFEIALQTGIAVVKAIASAPFPANIPAIAFATASGLAQAAFVAARPIPAFAKGTRHSPAGRALVGEAGAELLEYNGQMELVDRPTVKYLKGGTRVYTATETVKYFNSNAMSRQLAGGYAENEGVVAQVQKEFNGADAGRVLAGVLAPKFASLEDAVRNQPTNVMSMDKHGVHGWVVTANQKEEVMRKRYHRG